MPQTYDPLATTTVTTSATSIQFSNISQAYTDLRLIFHVVGNGTNIDSEFKLNSSSTGYSYSRVRANGSTITADSTINASIIYLDTLISGTIPSLYIVDIFNYTSAINKTFLWMRYEDKEAGTGNVGPNCGLWRNTSAITSITLGNAGAMGAGTTATLYGIKAV